MTTLKIAFRNIFRNQRRSVITLLTIALGTAACLVFGAYVTYIFLALETGTVQRIGHLTVYREGYFNFGSGNPSAYAIEDYDALMRRISADPVVGPRLAVITATQFVAGIAGNFDHDTSKPFFGMGFIPSDRDRMGEWQAQGIDGIRTGGGFGLTDSEPDKGIVGVGLSRVLGLCEALRVPNCPQAPVRKAGAATKASGGIDLGELASRDRRQGEAADQPSAPRIDLLAATSGGAPNVVTLTVSKAESQGLKELDDSYVGLPLPLAQRLLYGRSKPRVTGIVLQLHRTSDMEPIRRRLVAVFREHHLALEVRDFKELSSLYVQAVNLFSSIFFFIATIIGIIALFTTGNTIGMSVMERIEEIGTIRALGLRRAGIRRQFLLEGALLGALGAAAGVIFAAIVAVLVNAAGLTWTPPGQVSPVPLRLLLFSRWSLVTGTWVALVLVSTISAYFPANGAAKMPVVDALRHV